MPGVARPVHLPGPVGSCWLFKLGDIPSQLCSSRLTLCLSAQQTAMGTPSVKGQLSWPNVLCFLKLILHSQIRQICHTLKPLRLVILSPWIFWSLDPLPIRLSKCGFCEMANSKIALRGLLQELGAIFLLWSFCNYFQPSDNCEASWHHKTFGARRTVNYFISKVAPCWNTAYFWKAKSKLLQILCSNRVCRDIQRRGHALTDTLNNNFTRQKPQTYFDVLCWSLQNIHIHFNFLLKYFFVHRDNQRKKYIILYVVDHVKYNKQRLMGMQNIFKKYSKKL